MFSYELLDITLANLGLILVEGENRDLGGSNGSGKTNLFNSICWILYRQCPNYPTGDEVIREDENHEPIVGRTHGYLELQRGEDKIEVHRYRRHEQYGNKMLLYVNGEDLTLGSDAETLKRLIEFIGVDFDAFTNAVMFPQGELGFATKTDSKQKALLDNILGTQRFEQAQQQVKAELKTAVEEFQAVQSRISNILAAKLQHDQTISALETRQSERTTQRDRELQQIREQLAAQQRARPSVDEDQRARLQQQREGLFSAPVDWTQAESHLAQIPAWQKHAQELKQQQGRLEGQLTMLPESAATESVEPPGISLAEADQQLRTCEEQLRTRETEIRQVEQQLESLHKRIDHVSQAERCPTCQQAVGTAQRGKMHDDLRAELAKARQHDDRLRASRDELRAEQQRLQAVQKQASRFEAQQHSLQNEQRREQLLAATKDLVVQQEEAEHILAQLENFRTAIETYRKLTVEIDKQQSTVATWQQTCQQLQDREQTLANETDMFCDLIDAERRKISQIQEQHEQLTTAADELADKLDYLRFWEDGFGAKGIRSLLLDHATPAINAAAADYLEILSGGCATMEFHTTKQLKNGETRDDFHVEVKYENGAGDYRKISGGERQRPNLAAMFAIGDLAANRSPSPIMLRLLDEPFDNLDGLGAEQVVHLLQTKIVPKCGTVLVMTHDDNLKSLIPNRLIVTKEHGISRVLAV